MEISKNDWKLFREKLAGWQENYMDKLCKEYIAILNSDEGNPSDRFWKLEGRIKEDKKHPGVRMELRKSEVLYDLVSLIRLGVIGLVDLEGFSNELKESVKEILER